MALSAEEQRLEHGKALSDLAKADKADAVPGNDKAHAHSHAAHLQESGKTHLAPEDVGKQEREPGAVRQPPQDPQRNGKTHTRE